MQQKWQNFGFLVNTKNIPKGLKCKILGRIPKQSRNLFLRCYKGYSSELLLLMSFRTFEWSTGKGRRQYEMKMGKFQANFLILTSPTLNFASLFTSIEYQFWQRNSKLPACDIIGILEPLTRIVGGCGWPAISWISLLGRLYFETWLEARCSYRSWWELKTLRFRNLCIPCHWWEGQIVYM